MNNTTTLRLGWGGTILGLLSIVLLVVSATGYRQEWWAVLRALSVAEVGVWVAAAGLVTSVVGLAFWLRHGRRGLVPAVAGIVVSLPVLGLGVAWEVSTRMAPPINDISTDTANPPMFWDTPMPSDYPAANADVQRAAYPDVTPLELPLSPRGAFERAKALVEERGWEILAADDSEYRIEAVATSRLYGFEDEMAIRISDAADGSVVDVRSRSRIGKIDRGANARRIRAFLSEMERGSQP